MATRPYITLIEQALNEFSIHLQVEDIAGGVLLFWQAREDFDNSTRALKGFGANLKVPPSWDEGSTRWTLALLKPAGPLGGPSILEAFRDIILALFGSASEVKVTGTTISFCAPAAVKFLDALWRYYRAHGKAHAGGNH